MYGVTLALVYLYKPIVYFRYYKLIEQEDVVTNYYIILICLSPKKVDCF